MTAAVPTDLAGDATAAASAGRAAKRTHNSWAYQSRGNAILLQKLHRTSERMKLTRARALVIAQIGLPSVLAAQATIKITHFSPTTVEVRQAGRVVGATPLTIPATVGVNRLNIGAREICLYLFAGSAGEVVLAAGTIESLSHVLPCERVWSEVRVAEMPAGVTARSDEADGTGVTLRVRLPGRVGLHFAGSGYAPFSAEVDVGPQEIVTVRPRVGPRMPGLIADTLMQAIGPAPAIPVLPRLAAPPKDPTAELADAEFKLEILRSRQPADGVGTFTSWVFLGGAVASLLTGSAVARDSLKERPELRPPFYASLGVMTGGLVVTWVAKTSAIGKAQRAGCGSTKRAKERATCQREREARVAQLRRDKASYPQRRVMWSADTATTMAAFRDSAQEHQRLTLEWDRHRSRVEAHNRTADANRRRNETTLAAWRANAAAVQRLDIISRVKRP